VARAGFGDLACLIAIPGWRPCFARS
jgi:hypothetical protein